MASTFSLTFTAADGESPLSTDQDRSFKQLRAWLLKRLGGTNTGTDTIVARTAPVYASAVVTAAAVVNANTVTINGQALTATSHRARGTATCVSVAQNDALTVAGVTFTVKDAPSTALEVLTGVSDTAMAAAFVVAINANATTSALVKATSVLGVVHIKALATGTGGNSIGLSDTGTTITVSAANLAGGAAVGNNEFDFHAAFNNDTATALALAINSSTTAIVNKHVTAAASSAAVTITAVLPGHAGNIVTLATSGATLAITGSVSRLTGGTDTITTFTY